MARWSMSSGERVMGEGGSVRTLREAELPRPAAPVFDGAFGVLLVGDALPARERRAKASLPAVFFALCTEVHSTSTCTIVYNSAKQSPSRTASALIERFIMERRLAYLLLPAAFAVSITLIGCGHPASRAECDEIFNKSAEIELRLQNVIEPKIVAERTAAVRKDRGDALVQQCVGKRITDKAMACVRASKTSDEMDRCLD